MKEKIFVNFTNHPSMNWGDAQLNAALEYGWVVDVAFPMVDEGGNTAYIEELANEYLDKIMSYHPVAVLCQGEFCLAFKVISRLKECGIPVMAACSKRMVKEKGSIKEVEFCFCQFREY